MEFLLGDQQSQVPELVITQNILFADKDRSRAHHRRHISSNIT